jgi:hypothetical protein
VAWCDEIMMCHVLDKATTSTSAAISTFQSNQLAGRGDSNVVPVLDKTDKVWNKNGTRNENKTNMPVTDQSSPLELRSCKSESFIQPL